MSNDDNTERRENGADGESGDQTEDGQQGKGVFSQIGDFIGGGFGPYLAIGAVGLAAASGVGWLGLAAIGALSYVGVVAARGAGFGAAGNDQSSGNDEAAGSRDEEQSQQQGTARQRERETRSTRDHPPEETRGGFRRADIDSDVQCEQQSPSEENGRFPGGFERMPLDDLDIDATQQECTYDQEADLSRQTYPASTPRNPALACNAQNSPSM